jgi:hypothetical protein
MAALIQAIDNINIMQNGENGHKEYSWSKIIQESIVQLYAQLTRTQPEKIEHLGDKLDGIITKIHSNYNNGTISREQKIEMLSILYRMVGQTRELVDGKGEYSLSYMLIYRWYHFYPELAKYILELFVKIDNEHPYGSWKDIKYFCDYCKMKTDENHPLILYAMDLINNQLRIDLETTNPSLAAKWVPREKSSKFGWLFKKLATSYFQHYINSAQNDSQIKFATLKCFMKYRKLCSELNKKIDTVQIKQCSNKWETIDPSKQTSITMHKQKNAFLNKTKTGQQRSELKERIECSQHFQEFIRKAVNGEITIKGKRIGLNDFTRDALYLVHYKDTHMDAIHMLNAQWKDNAKQTGQLGKMIAMVDTSGSMSGDPLHAAIALGIRVAEKSILGKRIMTFSASPTWINLEPYDDFTDMVEKVSEANWGMNTNIYSALNMILDAIISQKLTADEVSDITLAIFSDMQIDDADKSSMSLYSSIQRKYEDAGIKICGKPYLPPHILFWNLRSTNGFPTLSFQPNVSCMSGFSPALLNLFCEEGLHALASSTPWTLLNKTLNNNRYDLLEDKLKSSFNFLS